ncbi:MAG TPA: hypothetical protein VKR61_05245 [Bryobacteraceae bacterium]|nr:hypothetical protein [Bryobacteraceae bacterium]
MVPVLGLLMVAGTAALSVRLYVEGLYRRYRAFFVYLIIATLRSGIFATLNPTGKLYYRVWIWTEPIEWFLFVLVVLEVYSLVLEDYKGLATVGRWSMIAAVVVALLASGLSLLAPSNITTQGLVLRYYYVAERAVYFSLLVFLLTILGVLMQYPISLSRNIIVHSIVFSVYFLALSLNYLVLSMFGEKVLDLVRFAVEAAALGAIGVWLLMLKEAGEQRKQKLRPAWMPGQEEALISQFNNLNAALLRVTRK